MDEYIKQLELDSFGYMIVIEPKYKRVSYGEMIYVYR